MNILLRTKINLPADDVFQRFNEELFKYLLPPGAKLIQFDGSKPGDIVHLHLPLAGEWLSKITFEEKNSNMCFFIDEGVKIPKPLKLWKHKHIVEARDWGCCIIDDITFSTGYLLLDVLIYPLLFMAFFPRKFQYKRYFHAKS